MVATALVLWITLVSFYPEYLWFSSFNFASIWWTTLTHTLGYALAGFGISALWFYCFDWRLEKVLFKTPKDSLFSFVSPAFSQVLTQLNLLKNPSGKPFKKSLLWTIGIAFFFGLWTKSHWQTIALYLYQTPYGVSDPIFGHDVSFYFFSLPFFEFVYHGCLGLVLITLIRTLVVSVTYSGIASLFSPYIQKNSLKTHLFSLVGLFIGLLSLAYFFKPFDLLYSKRGVVFGAGFTDVHTQLWGYMVSGIALSCAAVLVIIWGYRRDYKPLLIALATLAGLIFIVNGLYPGMVQSYQVAPNELAKEKPYLTHNIHFTRLAYKDRKSVV